VVLTFAVARRWPDVLVNGIEPGWVPTKMGGPAAPDDLSLAPLTHAWLAVSDEPAATGTGGYFFTRNRRKPTRPRATSRSRTNCSATAAQLCGVELPP